MASNGNINEQIVGIQDVYIPSGFDSGADAFVVVNGMFPNGCYSYKRSSVDHPGATAHEVKVYADVREGMCLMVLVPFHHEIQLGKLAVGDHTIRFLNGDGTYLEKHLVIEE